jgi:hypothetical protein
MGENAILGLDWPESDVVDENANEVLGDNE